MTVDRRGMLTLSGAATLSALLPPAAGLLPSGPARAAASRPATASRVRFDTQSLLIDGRRVYHWCGEFHYWRLPSPGLWRDVLEKYRAAGFTAASVYFHWGFHNATPGVYDFTGIRDVRLLMRMAREVGIAIVARPGPYINAETDSGGFPGWLDTQAGRARSSAADYLAAALDWAHTINTVLAPYQLDRGGPIILYQVENEYTYGTLDVGYMERLQAQAAADGITVPTFHNDASIRHDWLPGTPGGPGMYAFDSYPQGFDASRPEVWQQLPDFAGERAIGAQRSPMFVAESQGGSFDPWGGPGFAACRALTSAAFNRVYFKNNVASGLTMQSIYMLFGGTNWGWLASEQLYTSYDYGAGITEARQLTAKYDENKRLGYFLQAVTPITDTRQLPDIAGSNPVIRVRAMQNPHTGTHFITLLHRDTTATGSDRTSFPLTLRDGTYPTVPQLGHVQLNGRDAKILVAGYDLGTQRLVYATSEIMTHATIGGRDIALLYGRAGEAGETVLRFAARPAVQVLSGGDVAVAHAGGDLRLNYRHHGLCVLRIGSGAGSLLLLLADDDTAASFWRADTPAGAVLVAGPALLRGARLLGAVASLRGDTDAATTLTLYAPAEVSAVLWNDRPVAVRRDASGALQAVLPGPRPVTLPVLDAWTRQAGTPEQALAFDDRHWRDADHAGTDNPLQPRPDQPVLYRDEYGFHHGDVWYRGHFNATGQETAIALSAITGRPGKFSVWCNGRYLGSASGGLGDPQATESFRLPADALLAGADNVLAVLVENLGHSEDFATNDSHKQPRGLVFYQTQGIWGRLAWKIQGALGGERPVDPVRGAYNNGGLHGERAGWHLPDYPADDWTAVSLPHVAPEPGIVWYRTDFTLDLPRDQDVSLAVQIDDARSRTYRARLFVNGWQFGVYINQYGPQTRFVVPGGILRGQGRNSLVIASWGEDGTGGIGAVSLVVEGNVLGGVPVRDVPAPGYDPHRYTG